MGKYVVSMIDGRNLTKNKMYRITKEFSGQVTIVNDAGLEQDIIVDFINLYLTIFYTFFLQMGY